MPNGRLQQYHGATIEVELNIQGSPRLVSGKGIYDMANPDLGRVLRILVSDPEGDFEFLLSESKCAELHFESSDRPGCDYRLSLAPQLA